MATNYSEKRNEVLTGMGAIGADLPDVMGAFGKLHEASMKPGALDSKFKELLAVAISIAIRCEGCIACHVKDALTAGATTKKSWKQLEWRSRWAAAHLWLTAQKLRSLSTNTSPNRIPPGACVTLG